MFQDILRDTEIYKLIAEEGRAEEKLDGIQEQQQRELEHQRQMLLLIKKQPYQFM